MNESQFNVIKIINFFNPNVHLRKRIMLYNSIEFT